MRLLSSSFTRVLLLPVVVIAGLIACHEATAPAVPAKLAFIVQPPASTTAGTQILPAVTVAVQDANGNTVTSATNEVSISLANNPGNATLSGVTRATAINGVATFVNLVVNRTGAGYTLFASAENLTGVTSSPFEIKTGAAARLGFTVQPADATASAPISVAVAVQDASGNTVTTSAMAVNISISTNPTNATLNGVTTVVAVNGIATFSGLIINRAGTGYVLTAAAQGFGSAASQSFNILPGPAAKLAFTNQPSVVAPGVTMNPAVVVEVQDVGGNRIPSATPFITLSIGTNPSGATLSGNTTVRAANGIATFDNLSIDKPGADIILVASAADLAGGTSAPFTIRELLKFTAITAGYFHSCGISPGGSTFCWGSNSSGQLGSVESNTIAISAKAVSGGLGFATITGGRDHTCGLTPTGVAYCWGANDLGAIGNPGATGVGPSAVAGDLTFGWISAGYDHTCGVTTTGAGYCWGSNSFGELGINSSDRKAVPTAVAGGLSFTSINAGRDFSCGVTTASVAYCWGSNDGGWLGDGTTARRTIPTKVSSSLVFSSVAAGGFHSCGLTIAGAAYCWGSNGYGQLGNPASGGQSNVPVAVSGDLVFVTLSVGNRHNCGITADGRAWCWGDNVDGNLGDGTFTTRSTPVGVSGGLTFVSISAGRFHTCAVTTNNEGYCWGQSTLGGGTSATSNVPVRVQ